MDTRAAGSRSAILCTNRWAWGRSGSTRPRNRPGARSRPPGKSVRIAWHRGVVATRLGHHVFEPGAACTVSSKLCRPPRSNPRVAGTALMTCLPWLRTSMQCRAWLGASVATNTASIFGSFTRTSSDSYDLAQRQAFIRRVAPFGKRSLTATDLDIGMILETERAHRTGRRRSRRCRAALLRSDTGCHVGRFSRVARPIPPKPVARAAASDPSPATSRNSRRGQALFAGARLVVVKELGAVACRPSCAYPVQQVKSPRRSMLTVVAHPCAWSGLLRRLRSRALTWIGIANDGHDAFCMALARAAGLS